MSVSLTIRDESLGGQTTNELVVDFLRERVTVQELIRSRVYQEVQDYNTKREGAYRGLVQPTDAEQTLNGYLLKTRRQIDWKAQFEQACQAFQAGRILILVDELQVESLEQEIDLLPGTRVSFLKLMPLVGG